eukprot:TRINITY_DN49432_c0_g1_i1.p1 TRINITY_DN49432_c0_g1~~TRINITY_DN49432_c0_g1_i1.p1  ORF type:complete len:339 (+),score=66.21 TRINITY_DN49432_c0_g1_i1:150-1019(+)
MAAGEVGHSTTSAIQPATLNTSDGTPPTKDGSGGGRNAAALAKDVSQDLPDKIMEYQRREYALLSQMACRAREMRRLRRRAGEAAHSFAGTRKDSLRDAQVDPVVNIELAMLRQRIKDKDIEIDKLKEESQNATFHPNSIQGQKLLRKCSHLLEENSELARQLGEDRLQTLRVQIAVERRKRAQLRQRISEFDQYAEQIDAENERMQKKIADLGQCLKTARGEIDSTRKCIEEFNSCKKRPKEPKEKSADKTVEKAVVAAPFVPAPPSVDLDASVACGEKPPKRNRKGK